MKTNLRVSLFLLIVLSLPALVQANIVILSNTSPNHTVASGSHEKVYGTSISNQITLEAGARIELINFQGHNSILIQSRSDLFTVFRSGMVVNFQGSDGTVMKIPATGSVQTIAFNDRTLTLNIYNNQVMLDDQEITLIPALIRDVHTGVWEELPNTNMSAVYYDWSPHAAYPGGDNHRTVISAWNGAALDTMRNRMIFWGGGHSGYAGNEIYGFDFDSNSWSIVAEPDTYQSIVADMGTGPECTYGGITQSGKFPKTIHTYDGVDYYPNLDSFCSNFGAMAAVDCKNPNAFVCYDFTTNAWVLDGFTETTAGGATMYGAIHPLTHIWYGAGAGSMESSRFCKYDAATDIRIYGDDNNMLRTTSNKNFAIDYRKNIGVVYQQRNEGIYYADLDSFTKGITNPGKSRYALSGDSSWFNGNVAKRAGMDYDPVLDKMIFWPRAGSTVYAMNTLTGKMTAISSTGATPTDAANTGTFSRFKYIPKENKFALVNSTTENVFLLKLSTLTDITTITIKDVSEGKNIPLTIGQGFSKGDIPAGAKITFRLPDGYVLPTSYECKSFWNDGSCKHAIISTIIPKIKAGTDLELTISQSSELTDDRPDLSEADIVSASPNAAVVFDNGWTTVSLSKLLGSPVRIFFSGPDMVEAHYSQDIIEDTDVNVKFYVRFYSTGDVWIRIGIENGSLDGSAGKPQTYTPMLTIDSQVVYHTAITHFGHTRWSAEGWITPKSTDYTIKHDTNYLQATKLIPNYWKTGPGDTRLNSLTQTYTPMEVADWRENMGVAGYSQQIGLLPLWDALYINSNGDNRAYDSVIANAKALNSHPIIFRDSSTDSPIVLSSWPTWTVFGEDSGGTTAVGNDSNFKWYVSHHGSGGYLAYLLTGEYYHLETMQYQSTLCYLVISSVHGSGTQRLLEPVQTRSIAWAIRTIGQLVAVGPSDLITDDLKLMLSNSVNHWAVNDINLNGIGYWTHYSSGAWGGLMGVYMQHFLIQSLGYISDIEPLSSMENFNLVRDFGYKAIVGILGGNSSDDYCYTHAADPFVYVTTGGTGVSKNPDDFFDSWGKCWEKNWGSPNLSCGDTLTKEGSFASGPGNAKGYWANLLPAIAYAVDHGADGSDASWERLTGATNWSDVENAGFEDLPIWGIYPR